MTESPDGLFRMIVGRMPTEAELAEGTWVFGSQWLGWLRFPTLWCVLCGRIQMSSEPIPSDPCVANAGGRHAHPWDPEAPAALAIRQRWLSYPASGVEPHGKTHPLRADESLSASGDRRARTP